VVLLQALYIGRDVVRADGRKCQAALLAPGEEPGAHPGIGSTCMRVADIRGEEFDIAPARIIADVGDQRRHHQRRVHVGGRDLGLGNGGRKLSLGREVAYDRRS
jgi:hypothetical protein